MERLKVTAVSYLNTKPFLYGIFQSGLDQWMDISLDIPSACANKLLSGEADLGLIPVVAINQLEQPIIVSDYCIGAEGPVRTVSIFSEVPIEQVERLYLDYHSMTSVKLADILLKDYWHLAPTLMQAHPGFLTEIKGTTAGVVIGDRAISLSEKYKYSYDLSEIWTLHTGLPFVFAAWVSTKKLSTEFVQSFNRALQKGLELIPQLIALMPTPTHDFDIRAYFEENIRYHLDAPKKQAMQLFLDKVNSAQRKNELVFL